ncbi:MAG: hypothetical protein Q4C95_00850 [Planctomycetia bacterium]|nr:hypothetical protein [Planctomycetia bacterium]
MNDIRFHKFMVDIVLLLGLILLYFEKGTGHAVHEWTGILLFLLLLWHLCLNWNWIALCSRKFFGKLPLKTRLNFIWNIFLYWILCIMVFTGILISRVFTPGFNIKIVNDPFMSYVHHQLPKILFVMIGVHLIIHYRWIFQCCSLYFGKGSPRTQTLSNKESKELQEQKESK